MDIFLHVVHVLAAIGLIALILLQQGQGADAGASFGAGASQTVFGSGGSGNFLTRTTAILATIFFITSMSLSWMARQGAAGNESTLPGLDTVPAQQQQPNQQNTGETPAPAKQSSGGEVPTVPETQQNSAGGSSVPTAPTPSGGGSK